MNFTFTKSNIKSEGIDLINLYHQQTGVMVRTATVSNKLAFPSVVAFTGARFSRSSDTAEVILEEILSNQKDAGQRLATIFKGYGHASVADMANLFVFIENIPQYIASYFFYSTAVGGGQERSTRYQNFGNSKPEDLEKHLSAYLSCKHDSLSLSQILSNDNFCVLDKQFQKLQQISLDNYTFWQEKLTSVFANFYKIDINDSKQVSTLKARVFDTCRAFLLFGACNRTSLAYATSAREWARLISVFKAEKDLNLVFLANQLETLLAPSIDDYQTQLQALNYFPEAEHLIKYTQADFNHEITLQELQTFLTQSNFLDKFPTEFSFGEQDLQARHLQFSLNSSLKAFAQNILALYPNLNFNWICERILTFDKDWQQKLSVILTKNYNHHQQMGLTFRISADTFILTNSIAESRDLLRHRAWGRFSPLLSSVSNFKQVLDYGYVLSAYLTKNPSFSKITQEFEADLRSYYQSLQQFINDFEEWTYFDQQYFKPIIIQLLPFAHNTPIFMHAGPKEISYLTQLRVRPGGHINYRISAHQIAESYAEASALNFGFKLPKVPDPTNREEFLDRS